MTPLFEWDLKMLPEVVKWFQRARSIQMPDSDDFECDYDSDIWDSRSDDSYDENDAMDYLIPSWRKGDAYLSRVDRGLLDSIYQFIKGNAKDVPTYSAKRKRDYEIMQDYLKWQKARKEDWERKYGSTGENSGSDSEDSNESDDSQGSDDCHGSEDSDVEAQLIGS